MRRAVRAGTSSPHPAAVSTSVHSHLLAAPSRNPLKEIFKKHAETVTHVVPIVYICPQKDNYERYCRKNAPSSKPCRGPCDAAVCVVVEIGKRNLFAVCHEVNRSFLCAPPARILLRASSIQPDGKLLYLNLYFPYIVSFLKTITTMKKIYSLLASLLVCFMGGGDDGFGAVRTCD